jgi:hypothetical protein
MMSEDEAFHSENQLKKNLEFFAAVTQRTLSAFHVAGIDTSLTEEIDHLRDCLNPRQHILVNACIAPYPSTGGASDKGQDDCRADNEGEQVHRTFNNGDTDTVMKSQIYQPKFVEMRETESNPITESKTRKQSYISEIANSTHPKFVTRQPIRRASERIFFLSD